VSLVNNLADWLRQLITVLVLAGFIEMLAPENSLKKAVKLVIGLMVMLILIQPLTHFFKIPIDPDRVLSSSQGVKDQASQQVIERGLQIRNRWEERFNSQQRALVEEKIESVIGLIDGIDLKELRFFELKSGPSKALVRVAPAFGKKFSKTDKDKLTIKIQNSIRLVCNLSKEQIEVIWDENN